MQASYSSPTSEDDLDDEARDHIEAQARLLYGLVHARYIITTRGLGKMVSSAKVSLVQRARLTRQTQLDKYKRADFGRCPRVLCYQQPLLPVGLSDLPFQKAVKLFCPRCEDIYSPKSSRHGTIDGAFFGSTFPHMLVSGWGEIDLSQHRLRPSLLCLVYGLSSHAAVQVAYLAVALSSHQCKQRPRCGGSGRRGE